MLWTCSHISMLRGSERMNSFICSQLYCIRIIHYCSRRSPEVQCIGLHKSHAEYDDISINLLVPREPVKLFPYFDYVIAKFTKNILDIFFSNRMLVIYLWVVTLGVTILYRINHCRPSNCIPISIIEKR